MAAVPSRETVVYVSHLPSPVSTTDALFRMSVILQFFKALKTSVASSVLVKPKHSSAISERYLAEAWPNPVMPINLSGSSTTTPFSFARIVWIQVRNSSAVLRAAQGEYANASLRSSLAQYDEAGTDVCSKLGTTFASEFRWSRIEKSLMRTLLWRQIT